MLASVFVVITYRLGVKLALVMVYAGIFFIFG